MALSDLTREAVEKAMAEFDRLGREAFLRAHRFGPAKSYFVEHLGRRYDSKALAGVAHGYIGASFRPLKYRELKGGERTVQPVLEGLGFTVVKAGRSDITPSQSSGKNRAPDDSSEQRAFNPDWIRDELILTLDFYIRRGGMPNSSTDPEILALSDILNRLNATLGRGGGSTLRNANSVHMTVGNYAHLDPGQHAQGRLGIPRGGREQAAVWDEFSANPARLHELAETIRRIGGGSPAATPPDYDPDEIVEAPEGKVFTRLHRFRERDRGLADKRKARALRATGRLICEACDFNFFDVYGLRGQGFIEVHHIRPVHTLSEDSVTRLEDLALLCANCHRMVHAGRPWLAVEELRLIISSKRRL